MTSEGGQLQPELNEGGMLFQLTLTIPGVRRPNSTCKCMVLIPSSGVAVVVNLKVQLF